LEEVLRRASGTAVLDENEERWDERERRAEEGRPSLGNRLDQVAEIGDDDDEHLLPGSTGGHGHSHGPATPPGGHSHSHGGGGHGHGSMNMRALVLHVLGDALGNVGVIASGLIIWLTQWEYKYYSDPLISLIITVIIFSSALPLGKSFFFLPFPELPLIPST